MNEPTSRPGWLPPKFKTEQDLVNSYHAAERKISELTRNSRSQSPGKDTISGQVSATIKETQADPPSTEEQPDEQTPSDDGLELPELEFDTEAPPVPAHDPSKDRDEVSEAVAKAAAGELDEATISRLEIAGISRDVLSSIRQRMEEGQRAMAQLQAEEMTKTVGGVEAFNEVRKWAARELSSDEVSALDAQLSSTNPALVRRTVEQLHWQWKRAMGPTLLEGGMPPDHAPYYESRAQQVAAMKDPRYKTDPAYRRKVEQMSLNMR